MNEIIKTISKNDILEILNDKIQQTYGGHFVNFTDIETKTEMQKAINLFNVIAGEDVYSCIENKQHSVDGQYILRYHSRIIAGELLTFEDLDFYDKLKYCSDTSENVSIKVNPKLVPIVAREAKKMKLASDYNATENILCVRIKGSGSMHKKIMECMQEGNSYFEAPIEELTIQTARVYASMINKITPYKTKAVSAGNTTVIFFVPCPIEELICDIKSKIYNIGLFDDKSSFYKVRDYVEVLHQKFTIEKISAMEVTPEWKQKGFQSEQDYIDHVFDEEIKLKEDFDDINDEF